MRTCKGIRMGQKWVADAHFGGRKEGSTAAAWRSSDGRFRRPSGEIWMGGRGKTRRRRRASYRCGWGGDHGLNGPIEDLDRRPGVAMGRARFGEDGLTSCMTWPDWWGRVVSGEEGKRKGRGARAACGLGTRGRCRAVAGLVRPAWLSPFFFFPFLFLISFTDFEIELLFDSNKFCKICKKIRIINLKTLQPIPKYFIFK